HKELFLLDQAAGAQQVRQRLVHAGAEDLSFKHVEHPARRSDGQDEPLVAADAVPPGLPDGGGRGRLRRHGEAASLYCAVILASAAVVCAMLSRPILRTRVVLATRAAKACHPGRPPGPSESVPSGAFSTLGMKRARSIEGILCKRNPQGSPCSCGRRRWVPIRVSVKESKHVCTLVCRAGLARLD